jgi:serine/threonine protein kinase
MELCAATLQDFVYGRYKGPMPTNEQVLFQLANGLEYMHSMGIFHQDIKPENILISLTKPVQMKWSGFGSSKPVNERGTCSISGIRGTRSWMSPEELRMLESDNCVLRRGSVKSDIFSSGCVFIFFLLRGKHPFGDHSGLNTIIQNNIIDGNPVNVKGSLNFITQ